MHIPRTTKITCRGSMKPKKSPDLELHGHKKAWAKRERQGKGTRAARGRGEEEGEISILRWMSSKSPWTQAIASPSSSARRLSLSLPYPNAKGWERGTTRQVDTPLPNSKKTKNQQCPAGTGRAQENGRKKKTAPDNKNQRKNSRPSVNLRAKIEQTEIWLTTNWKTVDYKIANP